MRGGATSTDVGGRERYRLLDTPRLIELTESGGEGEFRRDYSDALNELLEIGDVRREPQWTESIAVGDREFVMGVAERVRGRTRLEITESPGGIWVVRDSASETAPIDGAGGGELYDGAMVVS